MARTKSEWLPWADSLRGLAALGVVVAHSVNTAQSASPLTLFDRLGLLTVPIFLVLSAFLAFRRHPEGPPAGYVRSHLLRIGIPYVLWASLYDVVTSLHSGAGWPAPQDIAWKVASAPYDLYFIPIVLQFYLLFGLMRKPALRRLVAHPLAIVASLALSVAYDAIFSGPQRDLWPHFYAFSGAWIVYFCLGAWAAQTWPSVVAALRRFPWHTLAAAIIGFFLLFAAVPKTAAFEPGVQVAVPLILPGVVALALSTRTPAWLQWVARHSFGLYLAHRLVYYMMSPQLGDLAPYQGFAAALLIQASFGFGVAWALSRLPWTRWAVAA